MAVISRNFALALTAEVSILGILDFALSDFCSN